MTVSTILIIMFLDYGVNRCDTTISMLFKVGHHANHIIHVTHARPFGLLCPEAMSAHARLATTPYVICCCVIQGHASGHDRLATPTSFEREYV